MKGDNGWLIIALCLWGGSIFSLTDHRLMADLPAAWDRGMCNFMGLATIPFKYAAIAAGVATLIYWFSAIQEDNSDEEVTDDE